MELEAARSLHRLNQVEEANGVRHPGGGGGGGGVGGGGVGGGWGGGGGVVKTFLHKSP